MYIYIMCRRIDMERDRADETISSLLQPIYIYSTCSDDDCSRLQCLYYRLSFGTYYCVEFNTSGL